MAEWYKINVGEVIRSLSSDPEKGLEDAQATFTSVDLGVSSTAGGLFFFAIEAEKILSHRRNKDILAAEVNA